MVASRSWACFSLGCLVVDSLVLHRGQARVVFHHQPASNGIHAMHLCTYGNDEPPCMHDGMIGVRVSAVSGTTSAMSESKEPWESA